MSMVGMAKLYWLAIVLLVTSKLWHSVEGEPAVPCYFIFGDSTVDNGNNNKLRTAANVNYSPYGIDFPGGPTGRFNNGLTTADVFGELMGFEDFIKSFPTAKGNDLLKGVNYGSGFAGIRDETGQHMGPCISLNKQLRNHRVIISHIANMLGKNGSTINHLKKCLYLVVIGSNDYINNYFLPSHYNTSRKYSPIKYAKVLIQQYTQQLKTLHRYGARKIALTGIGPIGCTPNATAFYGTNGSMCVDYMNDAANMFNNKLKSLVLELALNFTDAKFVYLKTFSFFSNYFYAPGTRHKAGGCCRVNGYGLCAHFKPPCEDRSLTIFWDSFHTTEAVNRLIATASYKDLKQIL